MSAVVFVRPEEYLLAMSLSGNLTLQSLEKWFAAKKGWLCSAIRSKINLTWRSSDVAAGLT